MDLGSVGFSVETKGSDEAVAALKNYIAETGRASRAAKEYTDQMNRFQKIRDDIAAKEVRENMARTRAMISLGKQREDAYRKEEIENERILQGLTRLAENVDYATRANNEYARSINLITQAQARNIITEDEAAVAIRNAQAQRAAHMNSMNLYMRDSRGAVQQLGYQIADFTVQVQSGTSVMVSLAQQGSQVLGMFGPYGAIAGAFLAIGSALVTSFIGARTEAESLDDVLRRAEGSFKSLDDTLQSLSDNKFAESFGELSSGMREMTEAALVLDQAMALKNLQETFEKIKSQYVEPGIFQNLASYTTAFGGAYGGVQGGVRGGTAGTAMAERIQEQIKKENFEALGFDIGYETFKGYQKAVDEAAAAGDLAEVNRTLTELFVKSAPDIESAQKIIASGGYDMLNAYRQLAVQVANANAEMAKYNDIQSATQLSAVQQDRVADERLIAEARQRADQEAIDRWKKFNQDRLADEKLISEAFAKSMLDAYLAGEDLSKLDTASGINAAAAAAAALAQKLGISLATAQAIVGLGNGRKEEIVYDPRDPRYDPERARVGRIKALMEGAPVWTPPKVDIVGTGGGSVGGAGGGSVDALAQLRRQIEAEKELLGLSEAQRRVQQALGDSRKNYSEAEIAQITAEIEALNAKQEVMKREQDIANVLKSSMEDAFMSMVDGTKSVGDAFKDMAKAIIAELFNVLVVQQLVGSWNSSTGTGSGLVGAIMSAFQADGGVWHNGSKIEAFANGGVVSRPTTFGMSGGRTGLMGEAGPEAIIPLKRGKDGKLGVAAATSGSSDIVINNNISVTGSDAAAVRSEVMKMLPQIANVTKASVLNARQRGGAFRDTFK